MEREIIINSVAVIVLKREVLKTDILPGFISISFADIFKSFELKLIELILQFLYETEGVFHFMDPALVMFLNARDASSFRPDNPLFLHPTDSTPDKKIRHVAVFCHRYKTFYHINIL